MEIKCLTCKRGINLDHVVFENYVGPVKWFSCTSMMEVEIKKGLLLEASSLISRKESFGARQKEATPVV